LKKLPFLTRRENLRGLGNSTGLNILCHSKRNEESGSGLTGLLDFQDSEIDYEFQSALSSKKLNH